MKLHILFFFVLTIVVTFGVTTIHCSPSPHTVSLIIKQYPDIDTEYEIKKAQQNLKNPYKIPRKVIKNTTRWENGVFSIYAGQIEVSNNSQIIFNRMHLKPEFYILVTDAIDPVFMFPNTIHHIEVLPNRPAALFSVKKVLDKKTQLHFWNAQEEPLPENHRIHKNSIVVLAKPKNVYVPTGITISNDDPQLILPTIYLKKQVNKLANALYILNIKQFFGSLYLKQKQTGAIVSSVLIR
ncbi:hypothetical protein HN446_04785 [bacterium]|jgi:hypothetical protein|nr:hypothetical protein [bacterium]